MAYSKQTWTNGDANTPLSGPRLTHVEEGIEDAHEAVDALSGDFDDLVDRVEALEQALLEAE